MAKQNTCTPEQLATLLATAENVADGKICAFSELVTDALQKTLERATCLHPVDITDQRLLEMLLSDLSLDPGEALDWEM